jgi:AbrB family looped-hinge helix DNA binding protein
MHVKIDQAGRVVLPKKVRDRFGLRKNSELELEESADGIVLKPTVEKQGLTRDKHGWLVHTGRPVGQIKWDRLVEDMHEQRIREIGGW